MNSNSHHHQEQPRRGRPYEPVDCGFHDELLDLATFGRMAEIEYRSELGEIRTVQDRIQDVYTRGGAEYLRLRDGTEIRLDTLLRVVATKTSGSEKP